MLSPLLYILYTSDCRHAHTSNTIVKFVDNTTVVGLISGGDESAYRNEVLKLSAWCSANNLALNTTKTKEIILDFRKHRADPPPLYIDGDCVDGVQTFTFLGTTISADLSGTAYTTAVINKAQQHLHFLRVLRKNNITVPGDLLLLNHWEHFNILHISMVHPLHWGRPEEALESGQDGTGDHRLPPPLSEGHLYIPLSESSETAPILLHTCLYCCSLAGTTGPSEPGQTGSETASFHKPSLHWTHTYTNLFFLCNGNKGFLFYLF